MISNSSGTFSADVKIRLVHGDGNWELGQLGPGFAILRTPQELSLSEAVIELIVDGKKLESRVKITSPITKASRRFSFEALDS